MPTARERFESQDFPGRISAIRDVLASLTEAHRDVIEVFGHDGLGRLEDLLLRSLLAVESVDAELVSQASIGRLMVIITTLKAEADEFLSDEDPSHLQKLLLELPDDLGDALLGWLHALPTEDAVSSVAGDFRRVLEAQLEEIRTSFTEVSDAMNELDQALIDRSEELSNALIEDTAKVQSSIGEQQARIDDLRKTIDEQRPRIDETIRAFETEFRESEKTREAKSDGSLWKSEAQFTELFDATETSSTDFFNRMEESLKRAQTLVGTIAVTGTAASYIEWANEQKRAANQWRIATVIAGLIAGAILLFDYQQSASGTKSIVHLVAGLVLFGIAGYSGQQSAIHRRREGLARDLSLRLIAFPPFTEELPEEAKIKVREKFADIVFVQDKPLEDSEVGISSSQVTVFSQLLEAVKKYVR